MTTRAAPRKQHSDQAQWEAAWATVWERTTELHVEERAAAVVEEIRADSTVKAYAWSGGKDSLVLGPLAEEAGVVESVLVISDLEWPAFLGWATDHMPHGLEVWDVGLDLEWLSLHPEMLFPPDAQTAAKWFRQVQHEGQTRYFHERGVETLLTGRRREDGNYCGPKGQVRYTNRRGVHRWSPIADWTNDEVIGFLRLRDLDLPPNYGWPRGFRVGTGPWPARQWTGGTTRGWEECWAIDPSVVRGAAQVLPSAARWMRRAGVT